MHGFGAAVEVIGTEIVIEGAVLEHVVGGGEDRGGEGADCLFGAAPRAQAMELRLEIAAVFAVGSSISGGSANNGRTSWPAMAGCACTSARTGRAGLIWARSVAGRRR